MSVAKISGIGILAGTILLGSTVLFGSWFTIDEGERGVLLRNGAITGTAEPGLGFKMPIIDGVEKISVQTQASIFENVSTYSRDQQPANLTISVNFRILPDQVRTIYADYGSLEGVVSRLIDRRVLEETKTVFGQYNAVTAIQERGRLNNEIETAIREAVKGPVVIESVQIENIDFSDAYEQSIEARMLAEVEVQKLRQNAEREKVQAEITVTQAQANADAVRAAAMAEAEAIKLKGQAEADAIKARGAALANNPSLIDLTAAEKWNGQLPTTMVPAGAMPFVGVK